jgi:hypothetical protein
MALALAAAAAVASTASANDLYWLGGTADLESANYVDSLTSTPNVAPNSTDTALIGEDGVANHSTGDLSLGRLFVGHNQTGGGADGLPGAGTVNVTGGSVSATLGASGSASAGIIVGYDNNGTLNVDGPSTSVSSNRLIVVGYGDNASASGTLNITNGASVNVSAGNLNIGDATTGGAGVPGHVFVNGNLSVNSTVQVGIRAGSSYAQTGGAVTAAGTVVGLNNADGSSFSLSGGTYTGTTFNVSTGSAASGGSDNNSVSFSGGTATFSGSMLIATGAANNTSVSLSGDASVTVGANLVLADNNSTADNTSLSIADNAHLAITGSGRSLFLGRASSTNTSFHMTGGTFDIATHFLMGTGPSPSGIVGTQSGGTITTASNFVVDDTTTGDATYSLSGTGVINAGGRIVVGRQHGTGTFNQTGGTASATFGVRIGDSQDTNTANYATGTYNVSGGTINASIPDPTTADALAVAPAGTGTLHISGGDATITVTGNMGVYANTNGGSNIGTLAYTLEAGESLTEINVTGTATFNLGSILSFDLGSATPTQTSYDLLTAADIIDNGLTFSAPTGWNFQIVSGGNGEILQAFTMAAAHNPGDTNSDGVVDLTDLNNVLNNFGVNATGNPGDDNSDGTVDLTDLNAVLNNFGVTYAAAALNVVPEPASLSLLALGATTLLARRRSR